MIWLHVQSYNKASLPLIFLLKTKYTHSLYTVPLNALVHCCVISFMTQWYYYDTTQNQYFGQNHTVHTPIAD